MKVFKFGGASVKNSSGIKNLARIVSGESGNLVIVVSALGKTTNALELLLKSWNSGDKNYKSHLENIYAYHSAISDELFQSDNSAKSKLDDSFLKLKEYMSSSKPSDYDYDYDQIVSYGEIWSTLIVNEFLKNEGLASDWIDIRKYLCTDNRFRDANILWPESTDRIVKNFGNRGSSVIVTQGFIGGTISGLTTTLGREGSDYTAAIIANILDAEAVVVWKDVAGLLNADPKWLPDAVKLDEVSYREAVEMTFSGAKVIHPKTIKPLQNKNIPLFVKSFLSPEEAGTKVIAEPVLKKILPVFIKKEKQILLSILPDDFSFVMGENLSRLFYMFMNQGIKVNLVEASAVSIDVCVDDERQKVEALLTELKSEYSVYYNENVELLSIRHYTPEAVEKVTGGTDILLEQKTRSTVRYVVRKG